MANTYAPSTGIGAIRLPYRTLFSRLRDWNDARRTRIMLGSLTAEQLDDIGLVPGDIDRIADRRF